MSNRRSPPSCGRLSSRRQWVLADHTDSPPAEILNKKSFNSFTCLFFSQKKAALIILVNSFSFSYVEVFYGRSRCRNSPSNKFANSDVAARQSVSFRFAIEQLAGEFDSKKKNNHKENKTRNFFVDNKFL